MLVESEIREEMNFLLTKFIVKMTEILGVRSSPDGAGEPQRSYEALLQPFYSFFHETKKEIRKVVLEAPVKDKTLRASLSALPCKLDVSLPIFDSFLVNLRKYEKRLQGAVQDIPLYQKKISSIQELNKRLKRKVKLLEDEKTKIPPLIEENKKLMAELCEKEIELEKSVLLTNFELQKFSKENELIKEEFKTLQKEFQDLKAKHDGSEEVLRKIEAIFDYPCPPGSQKHQKTALFISKVMERLEQRSSISERKISNLTALNNRFKAFIAQSEKENEKKVKIFNKLGDYVSKSKTILQDVDALAEEYSTFIKGPLSVKRIGEGFGESKNSWLQGNSSLLRTTF